MEAVAARVARVPAAAGTGHGGGGGGCQGPGSPGGDGCTGEPAAAGVRESAPAGALPSAWGGRGWRVGREAEMAALPLCITQQWCFASMVVQVSSTSMLSCGFSYSHPLRLSPCSQQQSSPQVCSPEPMFQHPAPVHTSRHTSQAGACRAVARTICVGLTLSCLPQTGCCTLL